MQKFRVFIFVCFFLPTLSRSQVNYVQNPSFEILDSCPVGNFIYPPRYWDTIRMGGGGGPEICSPCALSPSLRTPNNGIRPSFQMPKSGNNYCVYTCFIKETLFPSPTDQREYIQNELLQNLNSGKTYCVKFYVSLMNESKYAITELGAYFDDGSLHTSYFGVCNLTPQVKSPTGIFLADTLNWIKIEGTFIASGSEKYLTLGNFKGAFATTYTTMTPPPSPNDGQREVADYYFDNISVIEVDLVADAGQDKSVVLGDSVYIGRPKEVGLDEACIWYKLPNTVNLIDTGAGLWVKPVTTSTYVVRQEICGMVKWDTVVVYMNPLGFEKLKILTEELKLYPIPANDELKLSIEKTELIKDFHSFSIYNNLGLIIREEEMKFENGSLKIKTEDLPNGVYSLQLKSRTNETVSKRFVISR
jgi:hypothetical protein